MWPQVIININDMIFFAHRYATVCFGQENIHEKAQQWNFYGEQSFEKPQNQEFQVS